MKEPKMSLCELGFKLFRLGCYCCDHKRNRCKPAVSNFIGICGKLKRYEEEKLSSHTDVLIFLKFSHKLLDIPG
jgi:hypothetical protein